MVVGHLHNYGRLFLCFCGFFLAAAPANAQAPDADIPAWYEPFFLETAFYYHAPDFFAGIMQPSPGFRAKLGYEADRLRLFLSSGYSRSAGIEPYVESYSFVPLVLGIGYNLPIRNNWAVQADLGAGVHLSRTFHYETWIYLTTGSDLTIGAAKMFAETRLYMTYQPLHFLRFYAGGGLDTVFETGKPEPFPVLEIGLHFKPLTLLPRRDRTERAVPAPMPGPVPEPEEAAPEPEPEEPEPEETYPEPEPVPEPEPEPEEEEADPEPGPEEPEPEETHPEPGPEEPGTEGPEASWRTLSEYAVFFEADSTRLIESYRARLIEVGERLQAEPLARLTLRGNAAPHSTGIGQTTISAARVWFCVEYLKREFSIAEERMRMVYLPEDRPEMEDFEWHLRRRVDLIIELE